MLVVLLLLLAAICFILAAARVGAKHINFTGAGLFFVVCTLLYDKL